MTGLDLDMVNSSCDRVAREEHMGQMPKSCSCCVCEWSLGRDGKIEVVGWQD